MANVYKTNPIFLDTFSSDVDIALQAFGLTTAPVMIHSVHFFDPTANDIVKFKDNRGNILVELEALSTNGDVRISFDPPLCAFGLKLATADQTVTTGHVLIYV